MEEKPPEGSAGGKGPAEKPEKIALQAKWTAQEDTGMAKGIEWLKKYGKSLGVIVLLFFLVCWNYREYNDYLVESQKQEFLRLGRKYPWMNILTACRRRISRTPRIWRR